MPLFLSEEEFCLISNDAATVAERADAFIRDIRMQLDVVRAEADAKSIAVEQNCAIIEQKYAALSLEFLQLQSENAQLSASNEKQLSELAEAKAEKHQLHIKEIGKDAEIERLSLEVAELQKSKRHFLDIVEQKDAEIRERDATIQSYINKIVQLTEYNSSKESKLFEIEADLARCQAAFTRVTQEKELLEKQNLWLDEELTTKANTLVELRRSQMDVEADLTGKIAELERQVKEYSMSLNHSKERVKELELRVKSLEEDLCLSKDVAAGNEEHFISELSTVNKLVELYKASSEEWSKKAGELEGVIKALETHLNQVADDYKEKLEKESSLRKDLEKEADNLRMQLEKCEAELESTRKANESSLFPLSIVPFNTNVEEQMIGEVRSDLSQDSTRMLVPRVAAGVSGTALAASLLRDGWSLTKMYEKYQEAADALRHEKWGRRHAETVLERVLQEIEEKAEMILEERAEHERMVEAYTTMNEKLQQALLEHESYESALRKSKAELRRRERECSIAQKEISDLQNQVTVLLKECQDIQLRCGGTPQIYVNDTLTAAANFEGALLDADEVISQQHLNFKGISELVEQNVKLRSLVHKLAADIEKKEAELKDEFQVDLQRIADEAASKVEIVLKRSEEQASMIDSLHSSVAMYKRLYEEEQKFRSYHAPTATVSDDGKKELMLLFEGSQDISKKAYEHLSNRAKILEEELSKLSMELISARAERDKMLLEANFSKERLDSFIKEFDQQRVESNAVSARNIELTHLIVDYQKRLRENSASLQASEGTLRKLSLEVSILKHEKEILVSSEKRASAEIQSLTERVHRLQTSLDTIQSAEEIRENARAAERRKQDDYLRLIERDWAEAKKELQEERDRVRSLTLEKEKVTETSMRQVEDIQKELASAWHAVAAAESRAAVSEARFADLDARFKHAGKQVMTDGGKDDSTVLSTYETSEELWKVKEELEKMKDEVHASKDYMLQYKEVARTNEIALKQMEIAHENYKSEALKLKQALEDEVQSLKGQIFELERSYAIKCEEAVSANEAKEKALSSAMVETSRLRDEVAAKLKMVGEMEIQVTNLKDDLDKEHKRWRISQDNYERQVILQSETIQELTNTSKELSIMQAEVSRLRELFEAQKAENDLLKSSWEKEKTELQRMCHEADRKFIETDEQNKILHNRLEALHVRLAEKEQSSVGKSTVGSEGDGDVQKVINYLRRSKEITETEITLLKQEKLRLQSKLEGAIKASESAQAMLRSQLKKSSEFLLKDEEFKSLQLQVREINLLRESNVQLREENKHNFEECQKFHDEAQRSKAEAEKLENLLKLKQIEVDALQKDVEVLKNEIGNLNNKNTEMVERYKNIDINDYEEVKVQLEQYKESINKLEEELSRCREELCEREKKLNDAQKAEAQLIQDIERQKKHINVKSQIIAKKKEEFSSKIQALSKEVEDLKIKNCALVSENEELSSRNQALTKDKDDLSTKILSLTKEKDELLSKSLTLTKERDELNSKIQALLKQIEDLKSGRKVAGEMPTEQIKKEEEKDKRILMLEKTLEKLREDHRNEKQTRKKTEVAVIDFANRINMDKQKVEDELQKHKVAISVVLEKTGLLVSQLPSSSLLDERTVAYFQSISAFDTAASLFINDGEGFQSSPANASTLDSSATAAVQPAPTQQTKLPRAQLKASVEKAEEKAPNVGKASVEARKPGRRFVRPSLEKAEEPITDTEIAGMDTAISSDSNPSSSREHEPSADLAVTTVVRKRLTPSEPEIREGSALQDEVNVGAPPPSKRSKESELADISEVHDVPQSLEIGEEQRQEIPTSDISDMPIPQSKAELELDSDKLPLPSHEELIDMAKEDEDDIPVIEESEEQQQEDVDAANKDEAQYDGDVVTEELLDKPSASAESLDEGQKGEDIKEIMYTAAEVEEDREDGELMPDEHEQPPDGAPREGPHDTVTGEGAGSGDDNKDPVDIASPNNDQANLDSVDRVATDIEDAAEDTEKLDKTGGNDQGMHGTALSPEASTAAGSQGGSQITVQQNVGSGQQTPNAPAPSAETSESRVIRSSRTISIAESARRNAQVRQARMAAQQQQQQSQQQQQQQQQQPPRHGRAPFRRDGNRGRGRGGRG